MRTRLLLILLLLVIADSYGQNFRAGDSVVSRMVLIGDAGELTPDGHHPVVEAVERFIPLDKRTTVVYLGDNLYRHGLPDELVANYLSARAVLDSQANIADHSKGMVYFIPGNHDWMNGLPGGYGAVLRQQRYLDNLGKKNVKFYPEDGCPGPVAVDINDDVVLIMMDSQWWIHQEDKPGIESDCAQKTKEEVLSEIRNIVTANYKKLIIFACHHPFKSNGVHGGYFPLKQHIFPFTDLQKNLYIPLPIFGSIYPISRGIFGSQEDIQYPAYQNMISSIDEILKTHPHVIHVAGHEHALEWIADSSNHYIVSGSGCKTTRVSRSRTSRFVGPNLGFALLDVYKDKTVRCTFVGASPNDSFGKMLYTDTVFNYGRLPEQKKSDSTEPVYKFKDTVVVAASQKYKNPTAIRSFLLGKNYRAEWSTPVKLKEFNINKEKGGFKIRGAGGGFQTKTLHLVDKQGRRWNLRTIDKDPERVLPANMRGSFARDLVQDEISAAHPYAPLAVSELSHAAGIVETNREFFFVPSDPAFGFYRPMFANTVCVLEQGDPTDDNTRTKSTAKVLAKMLGDNDHFIEQREVLRARLLDMLIGDWDRHFDQWHWGVSDTGRGKLYYPIPRDRDQAFFNSDGFLLKVASRTRLRWMKGFDDRFHKFNWLAYSARDFDRLFLNRLEERDWNETIASFTAAETDTVIASAINKMPAEITAISGAELTRKSRSRRDHLPKKAIKYYKFISKRVNVLGSNKDEYFNVKKTDTGILVQVHAKEQGKDTTLLMYSRTFDPKITREIRLWGFNGNDIFDVDEALRTKTVIRIVGGKGKDTFNVKGRARTFLYDVSTENNPILAKRHSEVRISSDIQNNDFKLQEYQYSFNRYPSINLGYNPDDGILAGLGIIHRTYNFRKDPFSTEQRFSTLFSFTRQAFQLKYRGTFIDFSKGFDLIINGDLQNPALYNFYGLGNSTTKDSASSYYHARFNFLAGDVMLQKRPFKVLSIAAGPTFYYYWNKRETNDNRVLEHPERVGLDSNDIFRKKTYAGGKINVLVNNLNNELFPTRGIYWNTSFTALQPLNSASHPLTELHSDMTIYASLADPAKLVAVLRTGGGHIFSDHYEYFQAENVGANNYLRGFRKNRFSGRSMAYGSAELRAKVGTIKSYILPGDFGVLGFDDVARVWTESENLARWHNAYGVGVYFLPFNMFVLSGSVAFSKEETLFNLTLGTRLNLTF